MLTFSTEERGTVIICCWLTLHNAFTLHTIISSILYIQQIDYSSLKPYNTSHGNTLTAAWLPNKWKKGPVNWSKERKHYSDSQIRITCHEMQLQRLMGWASLGELNARLFLLFIHEVTLHCFLFILHYSTVEYINNSERTRVLINPRWLCALIPGTTGKTGGKCCACHQHRNDAALLLPCSRRSLSRRYFFPPIFYLQIPASAYPPPPPPPNHSPPVDIFKALKARQRLQPIPHRAPRCLRLDVCIMLKWGCSTWFPQSGCKSL